MASKKHSSSRIGEVLVLLLVLLLATSVAAKRHLVAAPNGDIGVNKKGAKIDRQGAQDIPWEPGTGGAPYFSPWGGYNPPSDTPQPKTKVKT